MMSIKEYIRNNSYTLFKSNNLTNKIVFDDRGFFFSEQAQLEYDKIKNTPHLYVAFTEDENGFFYIGKSFQNGGRWKRSHSYHLGTLAYHLLNKINKYDQNHKHWIEKWMDLETLEIGLNVHTIKLYHKVYISFIPFNKYANKEFENLLKEEIREINKKNEEALILSYILEEKKLLNIQKNKKTAIKKQKK